MRRIEKPVPTHDILIDALQLQRRFLQRFLEQLVHVSTADYKGHVVNGFTAAQIPDWEIRQQIQKIDEALYPPPPKQHMFDASDVSPDVCCVCGKVANYKTHLGN